MPYYAGTTSIIKRAANADDESDNGGTSFSVASHDFASDVAGETSSSITPSVTTYVIGGIAAAIVLFAIIMLMMRRSTARGGWMPTTATAGGFV